VGVKLIIEDILNDPDNGFGFMIRLNEEFPYRMMAFATSDNNDPTLRPKLEIIYKVRKIN
jgi:hypothetical protein